MKINFKKIQLIIPVIPFTLLLNSCGTNFEAVQNFSNTVFKIDKYASSVANDVYNSCRRGVQYDSATFTEFIEQRDINEQRCEQEVGARGTATNLKTAYTVLTVYMRTLGKLAGEDAAPLKNNLDHIETSLNDLTHQQHSDNIGAGIAIAKFLSNVWNKNFRHSNLKKAIVCTNPPIKSYIQGLVELTESVYIKGSLENEKQRIKGYYIKFTPRTEVEPSTLFEIEQSYNKAINTINKKKEYAQDFLEILKATADSHNELAGEFSSEAQKVNCEDLGQEDKTNKANQTPLEDPKQMKRVSDILTKYAKTIEPRIKKLDEAF